MLSIFAPAAPADYQITDPQEVRLAYKRYQKQILLATMIGYATFYIVRKNLSVAMPAMEANLGISKTDLGLFLTLHGVIYGISKFANGVLGDQSNAKAFMITGLLACALLNFSFGLSATVLAFGIIWLLNGWFQGMGFPPCARLMTHWFPPRELATKMSIWNTSHSIGAGLVVVLCGYLVHHFGWQWAFFVPGMIAVAVCIYLFFSLKDTPESLGLPEVEKINAAVPTNGSAGRQEDELESAEGSARYWMMRVFRNPYIWIIAVANFFVYTVRYAVFDWAPSILSQAKGFSIIEAGWITAAFEVAGIAGMLAAGWITDNLFGGRGGRTCFFYMAACTVVILAFWKLPTQGALQATVLMALAGFFIYGPQALVGIAVANLATKRAAATAVGLTGIFGYLSSIVSGWGLGYVAEHYGWTAGFRAMFGFSVVGTVLFALAWFAPAHGYGRRGTADETPGVRPS